MLRVMEDINESGTVFIFSELKRLTHIVETHDIMMRYKMSSIDSAVTLYILTTGF